MAYQLGRTGRLFIGEEASYGAAATLAATDAVRHLMAKLDYVPAERTDLPVRTTHPSVVSRMSGRKSGMWGANGIFYPSGTLGTDPDHSLALEHGLGTKKYTALSTTVSASPAPSTTVFTVASVTGLAAGDAIAVNCTGGATAGLYIRWIVSIDTLALTIQPALPQAPASTDTVKAVVNYKLATDLSKSLTVARYWDGVNYQGEGCVVDSLKFIFDANDTPRWEAGGPMKNRTRPAQTEPAAFTVVGTTPPTGCLGSLRLNAAAETFLGAEFTIENGMDLDNYAFGICTASGMYRKSKRKVSCSVKQYLSEDVSFWDLAEAYSTTNDLLIQNGTTEGSIVAIFAPNVEFAVPSDPDADELNELSFSGVCLGSAGNDEIYLAIA